MSTATKLLISMGVLSLVLIVAILSQTPARSATPPTQPEWTGLAGLANHACYKHKLVRQVFAAGAYTSGGIGDYTAVCMDGWAVTLKWPEEE